MGVSQPRSVQVVPTHTFTLEVGVGLAIQFQFDSKLKAILCSAGLALQFSV